LGSYRAAIYHKEGTKGEEHNNCSGEDRPTNNRFKCRVRRAVVGLERKTRSMKKVSKGEEKTDDPPEKERDPFRRKTRKVEKYEMVNEAVT